MKKIFLLLALASTILSSCSDSEEILHADFTAIVTGEAPNAKVVITNSSTGSSSYKWTFSQGANIAESSEQTPMTLSVDKTGDFTITLFIEEGSSNETTTKSFSIKGKNGINTFTDIEFAQDKDNTDYGHFFSISEGRILKTDEINETSGKTIDLVYYGSLSTFILFDSPKDLIFEKDFTIPGARATKITNYQNDFNATMFDATNNDDNFKNLVVIHDESIIGSLKFPLVVLFETAEGLKGAIKLKTINVDKLTVDIKVQKY